MDRPSEKQNMYVLFTQGVHDADVVRLPPI